MDYAPRLTAPLQGNKYFISTAGGGYNRCIERRGHWVLPNCFSGDTKIITRSGLVRLDSIVDQEVEVLSLGGVYRKATGRYFGKQELCEITLRSGHVYRCTANHRWAVYDSGEFRFVTTDNLTCGMDIPYCYEDMKDVVSTRVISIKPLRIEEDVYCVQEPETQTMTLEGNILTGNCTGYAYGRFMEIGGMTKCKLSTHNAGLWWGNTSDGYSRGKTPKLGAVICWSKGSEPGHVAIVERINKDGSIITSESGYSAKKDFWTQTRRNDGNWGQGAAYGFQGFIYNPSVDGGTLADDPQSTFVNYAKGKIGTKYYSSMQFIGESAKKAGILGDLIPDVICASDIGTSYKSSQGSILLGPANGYLNKPESGDIALIRTDQNRQFLSTTSCDIAGIVYSVGDTTMQILVLSDTLKVIMRTYSTSSKMIAGYFHPKWITVQSSSLSSDLTFAVSTQLYDSQNTKEDAIVREVAYFDGSDISKNWSGIRLSVTNYTTMLASMVNSTPSAAPTNLSASSQVYLTSGMKNQNARVILEFLVGKGLMESQAIGFLANIQMESGFLPSAVNRSSGASGICQWFQSRRTAMVNFVGSNWRNNLTGQCEYLWHELNTSEKGTLIKLRDKITKNTVEAAEDATLIVLYTFERPGRNEEAEERRKGYARDLWKQLVPQLKTV